MEKLYIDGKPGNYSPWPVWLMNKNTTNYSLVWAPYWRILRIIIQLNINNSDDVLLPHSRFKGGLLHIRLRWYAHMIDLINIWLRMMVSIRAHLFNITILVRHVTCYLNLLLCVNTNTRVCFYFPPPSLNSFWIGRFGPFDIFRIGYFGLVFDLEFQTGTKKCIDSFDHV